MLSQTFDQLSSEGDLAEDDFVCGLCLHDLEDFPPPVDLPPSDSSGIVSGPTQPTPADKTKATTRARSPPHPDLTQNPTPGTTSPPVLTVTLPTLTTISGTTPSTALASPGATEMMPTATLTPPGTTGTTPTTTTTETAQAAPTAAPAAAPNPANLDQHHQQANLARDREKQLQARERQLKKRELEASFTFQQATSQKVIISNMQMKIKDLELSNRNLKLQAEARNQPPTAESQAPPFNHGMINSQSHDLHQTISQLRDQMLRLEVEQLKQRVEQIAKPPACATQPTYPPTQAQPTYLTPPTLYAAAYQPHPWASLASLQLPSHPGIPPYQLLHPWITAPPHVLPNQQPPTHPATGHSPYSLPATLSLQPQGATLGQLPFQCTQRAQQAHLPPLSTGPPAGGPWRPAFRPTSNRQRAQPPPPYGGHKRHNHLNHAAGHRPGPHGPRQPPHPPVRRPEPCRRPEPHRTPPPGKYPDVTTTDGTTDSAESAPYIQGTHQPTTPPSVPRRSTDLPSSAGASSVTEAAHQGQEALPLWTVPDPTTEDDTLNTPRDDPPLALAPATQRELPLSATAEPHTAAPRREEPGDKEPSPPTNTACPPPLQSFLGVSPIRQGLG